MTAIAVPGLPENAPPPPSTRRTLAILARLAWRRFANQNAAGMAALWRKKGGEPEGSRKATPGKSKASLALSLWLVFSMMVGGAMQSYMMIERLSAFRTVDGELQIPERPRDAEAKSAIAKKEGPVWPAPPDDRLLVAALGMVQALACLGCLTFLLGTGMQDLGKVEWDMEWLFTFPVPARTLFLARLMQYAAGNVALMMLWFAGTPALIVLYACAGYGWQSLPLALAVSAYYAILITALGLLVEILAQKRLAAAHRKNLQAVFSVLGGLIVMLVFAIICSSSLDTPVMRIAHALPAAALANPLSLPALLCLDGECVLAAGAAMIFLGAAAPLGSVRLAEWLVKDGLVSSSGVYQGGRGQAASIGGSAGLLRGIVGKELRLLARDRALLAQTLLMPPALLAFYAALYWDHAAEVIQNPRHVSAVAFALGSYVLVFSAFRVLTAEGGALWLLYTFPRPLHAILLEKTFLWGGFAALYAALALAGACLMGLPLDAEALAAGSFAVAGVIIYAFVAAAIGVLASNPLETGTPRAMRLDLTYFYMALVSLYAGAIYAPSLWAQLAQVVLSALVAIAFWQKALDHLPYLLEPAQDPPARLSLADGLVAALAFLTVQTFVAIPLRHGTELQLGEQVLIAFTVAGAGAGLGALFFLRRTPGLLAATGIVVAPGEARPGLLQVLAPGVLAGVLAGCFALGYLAVVNKVETLRVWKESFVVSLSPVRDLALFTMVVLAAPLFEEFIFRGLIYRGMERTLRPAYAVVGSAAIFAVVHPPVSVIPVFVLGIAAALSFRRSGLLWTPIITHMIYNALVVTSEWIL